MTPLVPLSVNDLRPACRGRRSCRPAADSEVGRYEARSPKMALVTLLVLLIAALGTEAAQAQAVAEPPAAASDQAARLSAQPPDAETVRALVERLGSGSFDEREEATHQLLDLGSAAFGVLEQSYCGTDDYEVRLRIRDIVELIFFHEELFSTIGFLGVQLRIVDRAVDDRVPPGHTGVWLDRIVPDTAARRAGLRQGDLIVEMDGQPLPAGLTSAEFRRRIRDAGPGTLIRFTVDRNGQLLPVDVVLGYRPLKYYVEDASPIYLQKLEETNRKFHRWWRQRFGTSPEPHRPRFGRTSVPVRPRPPGSGRSPAKPAASP